MLRKTVSTLLAGVAFGTAIFSTSAQAESQIQNLQNGNYKFCSNPPPTNQASSASMENAGYCFMFRKKGNRLVGNYYDARSFGEVSVCVTGTLSNNILTGEAVELVGDIGRQSSPPSSEGTQLVKWDKQGYLRVAGAKVIRRTQTGSRTVHYRRALLNLNGFYRYKPGERQPPTNCFN